MKVTRLILLSAWVFLLPLGAWAASSSSPTTAGGGGGSSVTIGAALPAGTNNIGDVDVLTLPAIPAGTNNIGDVDVLTVPTDPFGANADAASATGSISAKLRSLATNTALLVADPCASTTKTHIVINIAAATTTELTPSLSGASTSWYVCSIDLIVAAANNVALVDDNTDGCGSVTAGLAGGTTAATGWNFAANGGIVKGTGAGTVFKSVTQNSVLCLVTSGAGQVSGSIQVVAAP